MLYIIAFIVIQFTVFHTVMYYKTGETPLELYKDFYNTFKEDIIPVSIILFVIILVCEPVLLVMAYNNRDN